MPDSGKRGISTFIVPTKTPGYLVTRIEDKMGQRASDTCQIVPENVAVPLENRLGEEGDGYQIALANLVSGRIGTASQAVGLARSAFDAALAYAKERKTFSNAIIDHQAVGFRLADMATEIESARQLVRHTSALHDAGRPCLVEASMAKKPQSTWRKRCVRMRYKRSAGMGILKTIHWNASCATRRLRGLMKDRTTSKDWISRALAREG